MKKSVLLLSALFTIFLEAKEITLTIINTRNTPVILNCLVAHKPEIGIFGILIEADTQEELVIPELYWFAKQSLGLRAPIKLVDVLNHAFPTKIEFAIPNEANQHLTIKPASSTVKISPTSKATVVTMKKARS